MSAFRPATTTTGGITESGSTTTTRYILTDHLGGSTIVTAGGGTIVETMDYYPYGSMRTDTKAGTYTGEKRGYIGERYDSQSQLSYLNARYYNGARGQFASQDPVFWEVGMTKDGKAILLNPQAQNSYSYAGGNPIVKSDPSGRCPFCPVLVAGALGGVGGIGVQAFNDYFSGEFGQRTWSENLSTYGVAIVSGFTIGAGVATAGLLTAAAGFTALGGAITVAGTSGILTAATTVGGDRILGRQTGSNVFLATTLMSTLTAGILKMAPKVPGRLPNLNSSAMYTGAHTIRQGAEELFSSSLQIYSQTLAQTFSLSGGSYSGGASLSSSQQSAIGSVLSAFSPSNSAQAAAIQGVLNAFAK